jgi:hypothetical protein
VNYTKQQTIIDYIKLYEQINLCYMKQRKKNIEVKKNVEEAKQTVRAKKF